VGANNNKESITMLIGSTSQDLKQILKVESLIENHSQQEEEEAIEVVKISMLAHQEVADTKIHIQSSITRKRRLSINRKRTLIGHQDSKNTERKTMIRVNIMSMMIALTNNTDKKEAMAPVTTTKAILANQVATMRIEEAQELTTVTTPTIHKTLVNKVNIKIKSTIKSHMKILKMLHKPLVSVAKQNKFLLNIKKNSQLQKSKKNY